MKKTDRAEDGAERPRRKREPYDRNEWRRVEPEADAYDEREVAGNAVPERTRDGTALAVSITDAGEPGRKWSARDARMGP